MTKTERYVRKQIKTLEKDIVFDGQVYSRGMLAAFQLVLQRIEDEKIDEFLDEVPL